MLPTFRGWGLWGLLVLALGPHRKRDVSPVLYHDRSTTGSLIRIVSQHSGESAIRLCILLQHVALSEKARLCLQRRMPLKSELDFATMLMQFATALLLLPSSPTNSAQIGNIFYLVMLLFQERRSREDTGSIGRRALVDPFESPAMRVLVR